MLDVANVSNQRAELTFKFNKGEGRHGWLRLTPAYSVKIVHDILSATTGKLNVFDPFSGTATTTLSAAILGHNAVSVDINPFLVWFGQAKLASYSRSTLDACREIGAKIEKLANNPLAPCSAAPEIHNIERWWKQDVLGYLLRLRSQIESETEARSPERDLLDIAFCRTMILLSNAAFNHQSMSFKDDVHDAPLFAAKGDEFDHFSRELATVLNSSAESPSGIGRVILGDSRHADKSLTEKFDLLITSPPYPNRMSYVRELRPYMYWLGFLSEAREAGELDWRAIGGTWGIATSRVAEWRRSDDTYLPGFLNDQLARIERASATSGKVLSRYVGKYFEDMWHHIKSASRIMRSNGKVHYIVGNSKFYDVIVDVERIFAAMLEKSGFSNVHTRKIRKRNSKKELYEFDVSANAPAK
ncbi:MAG TPA: hypothetical protein VKX17_19265 [Planctomycetota bacterium]|nr:hypothetical protein [Planctomycetota bacterium]